MSMDPKQFYKAANLSGNPFRSTPTQEADPRMSIWVGYEKERKTLVKFLERTRADQVGNINFVMVYGEFGSGKSHALLWAKQQILTAQREVYDSVVFYIQTLRKDAGKLSFASALKEDIVAKSSLVDDVLRYKQFMDECIVDYKRENKLGPEVTAEAVLERLLRSAELVNVAKVVLKCQTPAEVRALLIPPTLGDYQAMVTLTRVINLFVFDVEVGKSNRRFKKAAYLFIDELDLLASSPAKEARDVNELIRHIYDNCPNCFCLILAFTATAAEINVLFAEYVLSRVARQIRMEFLSVDDAKAFVKEILDLNRLPGKGKKGYFPFEEGAVEMVASQIVSITPRKVIDAMQQLLEECRLSGLDPSKTLITAEYLNDTDILSEVLGRA